MKLNIEYEKEKDTENFLKGRWAKNRKTNTPVEEEFLKYYDEFTEANLSKFIDEYSTKEGYDIPKAIENAKAQWSAVEETFIKKCEEMFGISYPIESVTGYFTLNNRCTYNTAGNYFFMSIRSTYLPSTIMHELLHFYTWKAFGKDMIENGHDPAKYNEIKESLTVLLNTVFVDLMDGNVDSGYPQHKEMREKITELWHKNHTVKEIIENL